MIKTQSYLLNPILTADPQNSWENRAVFNGSVSRFGDEYLMAYRAIGSKVTIEDKEIELSTIGLAHSRDLHSFFDRRQIIKPEFIWEKYGCEDPRICQLGDDYYIFYTALGAYPPTANSIKVAVAKTRDFKTFEKHLVTPFNAKAMAIFPRLINGKIMAVLTVHTDLPPSRICLAAFDKTEDLWSEDYWRQWYREFKNHEINLYRITTDHLEIGAVPVETADGWLLVYSHIQNYFAGKQAVFGIEAMLLDKNNPQKIVGRTKEPLLVPQENYELEGMVPNVIFPSGSLIHHNDLFIYYGAADTVCALAMVNLTELLDELKKNVNYPPKLKRYAGNPIITPKEDSGWESKATFNPAAVLIDDEIHIIYRAMNSNNTSVFGHAVSKDGFAITSRDPEPICSPVFDFDTKKNPDSFSGCEDPRATRIGQKIYICNTAFDGVNPPKIVLTSITVNDFVNKRWNFKKPVVISDPDIEDKDGCLFPELINGQYVFLHRAGGRCIMTDFVDNLDFENNQHLEDEGCFLLGPYQWENAKMGVAAPPIKTPWGWFLLYHGVSSADRHYRVGAMLLKLDDPRVILGRTKYPLLEPEEDYEKNGEVPNVVFPCGAVVEDGTLYVYYGAADKVIGVVTGDFKEIIDSLI